MSTFRLDILASDRDFFHGEAEELVFPSTDGMRGVLPGHEGMICCLNAGEMKFRVDGKWQYAIISDGFVEIMPTHVKILADTIERPEEIDVNRAQAAKQRAEERLRQQLSTKQYIHTQAALKRAMARLNASGRK